MGISARKIQKLIFDFKSDVNDPFLIYKVIKILYDYNLQLDSLIFRCLIIYINIDNYHHRFTVIKKC